MIVHDAAKIADLIILPGWKSDWFIKFDESAAEWGKVTARCLFLSHEATAAAIFGRGGVWRREMGVRGQ